MQRTGKQKKGQHAVQQGFAEVDAAHEPGRMSHVDQARLAQQHKAERHQQADYHQAHGGGQTQVAVIEVIGQRGGGKNGGDRLKQSHG